MTTKQYITYKNKQQMNKGDQMIRW